MTRFDQLLEDTYRSLIGEKQAVSAIQKVGDRATEYKEKPMYKKPFDKGGREATAKMKKVDAAMLKLADTELQTLKALTAKQKKNAQAALKK